MIRFAPGVVLALAIALLSQFLAGFDMFSAYGLSTLTFSIVLGILLGNSLYPHIGPSFGAGVGFSKHWLLRAGIVLYGFRLTFQDIANVGVSGAIIDVLVIVTTFAIAMFVGRRLFKLDAPTCILVGTGSSICGAAAVLGAEPVIRARSDQVSIAVSTVVVFGTLSMFLYPAAQGFLGSYFDTPERMGIFIGSTIHEIAQVVAAGKAMGPEVADIAVIVKMVRVMMLAPFLLILAFFWRAPSEGKRKISVPWFAFGFIALVAFHSLVILPEALIDVLLQIDTIFLAMAMASLGLTTHISAIRKAGLRPLLLAGALFVWLVVGGGFMNILVLQLLG